ncbi:hypothetical protein pb186bvf_019857 [Paramecium bursaria]
MLMMRVIIEAFGRFFSSSKFLRTHSKRKAVQVSLNPDSDFASYDNLDMPFVSEIKIMIIMKIIKLNFYLCHRDMIWRQMNKLKIIKYSIKVLINIYLLCTLWLSFYLIQTLSIAQYLIDLEGCQTKSFTGYYSTYRSKENTLSSLDLNRSIQINTQALSFISQNEINVTQRVQVRIPPENVAEGSFEMDFLTNSDVQFQQIEYGIIFRDRIFAFDSISSFFVRLAILNTDKEVYQISKIEYHKLVLLKGEERNRQLWHESSFIVMCRFKRRIHPINIIRFEEVARSSETFEETESIFQFLYVLPTQ